METSVQSPEQDPRSIHYSQISIIRSKGPIIKSWIQSYTQGFWGRFCRMKGKLGNKIIFEAGKTLWLIVLTINLLYPYPYRHLQYSPKLLKQLCAFPLPQCCLEYSSRLSNPKYAWLNNEEGEGQISVRIMVWRLNTGNLQENSRDTVSASTISDEYCR